MNAARVLAPACVALLFGCASGYAPRAAAPAYPPPAYPYPYAYAPYGAPPPAGASAPPPAYAPLPASVPNVPQSGGALALTPPAPAVGSPLPSGWAWPINPDAIMQGLSQEIYRPVNVQALQALAGKGPCSPIEVAPSVWVAPLCDKLPTLSFSPKAGAPPAATTTPTAVPSQVDFRALGIDGPIKDQQEAGVCWSFAISTLMDDAVRRAGRSDVLAPLHIIADDEVKMLFEKGNGAPLVLENAWTYDPHKACKLDEHPGDRTFCQQAYNIQSNSWQSDPALVAERARAESSGTYRILTFHPIKHNPTNPDDIARVLATGQAVYAGFDIDMKAWSAANRRNGGTIADWNPDGSGGHAVALVGYRAGPNGRQFLVHNSWGRGWGDGGYGWVSEDMVKSRINDAFTVTVGDSKGALPLPTPAPGPSPSPAPAPAPAPAPRGTTIPFPFPAPSTSGCGPNTVRDLLLGTCVAPCAGNVSPVAGVCPVLSSPFAPPPSTRSCAAGAQPDFVTGQCEPTCPSGRARAAGVCFF